MKWRLSRKWGEAHNLYYQMNPDTKDKTYFNQKVWSKAAIKASLDMSLGMWDNRCNVLHGRTEDEKRKIKQDKILGKAQQCYNQQDRVLEHDIHVFTGEMETLENSGTLYLEKWIASYKVAASQKTQLERQLERQGGLGAGIVHSDHPVSITASTHGQSMETINQATYGPDG